MVEGDSVPNPDQAWKALSLVNDWIRHAESKVAATLAATGVSSGVLFAIWKDWGDPSWVAVALGFLAAITLLAAGWACAMGLLPRRTVGTEDDGIVAYLHVASTWVRSKLNRRSSSPTDDGTAPEDLVSLLFYSSITSAYGDKGPEYREVLAALTADPVGMTAHVGQQVWANSSVAERKFNWANRAIARLLGAWAFLAVLAYFRVAGW